MIRIWIIMGCLLWSHLCFGQTSGEKREAIELIEQGNVEFESGNFGPALTKYRKAYRWAPDVRLLYRIGLTYESLRNYQRAREHYELFVLQQPTHEFGPRIKKKIEALRELEKKQAFLALDTTPRGAAVFMGGEEEEAIGMTPAKIPIHPGSHVVRFVLDGFAPMQDEIVVGEGQEVQRTYDLTEGIEVVEEPVAVEPVEVPTVEVPTGESPAIVPDSTTLHHVTFGPSIGIRVLSWSGVVLGFWTIVAGFIVSDFKLSGAGLLVFGAGSYGVFGHNYENQLPDANPHSAPEAATQLRMSFEF